MQWNTNLKTNAQKVMEWILGYKSTLNLSEC